MKNRCPVCKKDFSSDLRFCPSCLSPGRPTRATRWRYDEPGLVRETTPDEDAVRTCMRQNAYVLFCCVILLVPPLYFAVEAIVMELTSRAMDLTIVLLGFIAIIVFVLVLYGIIQAWKGERPGAQIAAALLIWIATSWYSPTVFLVSGVLFSLVWGAAASKTGSFLRPDPSYLVVLSAIALLDILVAYLWVLSAPMGGLL